MTLWSLIVHATSNGFVLRTNGMPRMEDAAFNQKTSAYILKIKNANGQDIKVPYWIEFGGLMGVVSEHFSRCWYPKKYLNIATRFWPMQAAIDDIDNATSTVRGWKSRYLAVIGVSMGHIQSVTSKIQQVSNIATFKFPRTPNYPGQIETKHPTQVSKARKGKLRKSCWRIRRKHRLT